MRLGAILRTASQAAACVEKWAAVLLILVMVTAVTMQVIWRFVLASPLAWTEEAARLAMIWMVFMVVGWAIGNRTHIAANFIVQNFPRGGSDGSRRDPRPLSQRSPFSSWLPALAS